MRASRRRRVTRGGPGGGGAEDLVDDGIQRGGEQGAGRWVYPDLGGSRHPRCPSSGADAARHAGADGWRRGRDPRLPWPGWPAPATPPGGWSRWRSATTARPQGLTAAALAMLSVCASGKSPRRTAASVAGRRCSRLEVSRLLRAAPTELPDLRARYSIDERSPSRAQARDWSTRAASRVLADAPAARWRRRHPYPPRWRLRQRHVTRHQAAQLRAHDGLHITDLPELDAYEHLYDVTHILTMWLPQQAISKDFAGFMPCGYMCVPASPSGTHPPREAEWGA